MSRFKNPLILTAVTLFCVTGCLADLNKCAKDEKSPDCLKIARAAAGAAGGAAPSTEAKDCLRGTANCDGNPSNGCETLLSEDENNCGECGNICSFAHATAECSAGSCAMGVCDPDFGDCDKDPSNGCEAPLNTTTNCGACGALCDLANASESCETGTCTLVSCDAGFGDCDGDPSNGCEPLSTFYQDIDNDGYGDPLVTVTGCSAPEGYVAKKPDNCPYTSNPDQKDANGNGIGDICEGKGERPSAMAIGGGKTVVVGATQLATSNQDAFIIAYSDTPQPLWYAQSDRGTIDNFVDVKIGASGAIYATGWSYNTTTLGDIVTIKHNSNGTEAWARVYHSGSDLSTGLAIDADENVYVVGQVSDLITLIKYDSSGNQIWVKTYSNSKGYARQVVLSPDGQRIYVIGNTMGATISEMDYLVLIFDAVGNIVGTIRYNGSLNAGDFATAGVVDPLSGSLYTTGSSNESSKQMMLTMKIDKDAKIWSDLFSEGVAGAGTSAIAFNPQIGGPVVAGTAPQPTTTYTYTDVVVVQYNASGQKAWTKIFNPFDREDYPVDASVDSTGNVYIAGYSSNQEARTGYFLTKYDSQGNFLWSKRVTGDWSGYGVAIALDSKEYPVITGYVYNNVTSEDVLTVWYDPQGNELARWKIF
ncbi:MAG: hypothetical protein HY391_05350 [Deltaproteobacteria bacterium]|nr:hypothetical protein [Deltaproteobacteria bacterium]